MLARALALAFAFAALAACGHDALTAGAPCAFPPPISGRATTYTGTSADGSCSFPAGLALFASVAPSVYADAAACGTCLQVTGPAATVTLDVVGLCPGCDATQLDLSSGAWDAVTGGAVAGVAPITWVRVPCDEPGPVRFVAASGVNAYWAGIVVEDHRYPLAAVEMLPAGGTAWLPLARQTYNWWTRSATGGAFATPLRFRATDVFGDVTATTVSMPALEPGAEATAPQFGAACGG